MRLIAVHYDSICYDRLRVMEEKAMVEECLWEEGANSWELIRDKMWVLAGIPEGHKVVPRDVAGDLWRWPPS